MFSYIKEAEYKVFKTNFVYQATLLVRFDKDYDIESKEKEIYALLKMAADKVEEIKDSQIIANFNEKGSLYLNNRGILVFIPGVIYDSVHSFDFSFSILESLIRILSVDSFEISLTKENKFKTKYDVKNNNEWFIFLSSIVSPAFMEASVLKDDYHRQFLLTQNNWFSVSAEASWNETKEDADNSIYIVMSGYFYSIEKHKEDISKLIYDIDKDIFNVWHWAINDDIINVMDGGK